MTVRGPANPPAYQTVTDARDGDESAMVVSAAAQSLSRASGNKRTGVKFFVVVALVF
jgi:hypothetical protein